MFCKKLFGLLSSKLLIGQRVFCKNILIGQRNLKRDNNTQESFGIFGDVLFEILTIFDLYRGHDFIVGGDFNVDFKRTGSRNLGLLNQFIEEEMLCCVSLQCPNTEFTYQNSVGNKSFIDHFIVSESLNNCKVNISYDGNNFTEHKPLTFETTCLSIMILDKIT